MFLYLYCNETAMRQSQSAINLQPNESTWHLSGIQVSHPASSQNLTDLNQKFKNLQIVT